MSSAASAVAVICFRCEAWATVWEAMVAVWDLISHSSDEHSDSRLEISLSERASELSKVDAWARRETASSRNSLARAIL